MSTYDTPARSHRHADDRAVDDRRPASVDETKVSTSERTNTALRALGAVAGAVPVVIGAIALIRLDWDAGFDAAPVDVAGMAFTPVVAIATVVLGLLAIAVAASPAREGKLVVGGLLACGGLAILIAGDSRADLDLESGHGWMALLVGAVLVVTGVMMRSWVRSRRTVHTEAV